MLRKSATACRLTFRKKGHTMNSAGLVFSLIMFFQGESFVIDHGLTRADCKMESAYAESVGATVSCELEGIAL